MTASSKGITTANKVNSNISSAMSTHNSDATAHNSKADKTGGASQITDTVAHSNLGTNAGATQSVINNAIDNKLGELESAIDGIEEDMLS